MQKWLTELGLFYESIGPSMATMAEIVVGTIRRRTKHGVDRNGNVFQPYSERYAQRKGQQNVDLTGKEGGNRGRPPLLHSFGVDESGKQRVVADSRGRGSRLRVQETGRFAAADRDLELGIVFNNAESARIGWAHEQGLQTGRSKMPARPWMGITEMEAQEAFDAFGQRLHVMRSTTENVNINLNFG